MDGKGNKIDLANVSQINTRKALKVDTEDFGLNELAETIKEPFKSHNINEI